LHRLLKRQLERLGLTSATLPDAGLWTRLLERISASYSQSDEARQLSERSMEISSRELHDLHERERQAKEQLEQRVRERTAELENAELAARNSEARFRSLAGLSSDIYWEQDQDYRFTSFSGTGTEEVTPANLQWVGQKRWEQNYLNMSAADWAAHIALLDARRPFRDLELCRLTDAGNKLWISVSGEPVFDASGNFRGYHGVGRDITARKRTEALQALEHAVTRTLAEADSGPGGLSAVLRAVCETEGWECGRCFAADLEAGVLRLREAWGVRDREIEQFISLSRDMTYAPGVGLAGRVWQSGQLLWVADVNKDARVSAAGRARESGIRGAFVFPVISDGKTIGVLIFNSREIREPEARLQQAVRVIGSQVGQFLQRKQAQEVLRESEERFRATFEQAAVGISRVDLTGVLMDVNQKFCDMLGYSKDELLGKHIGAITHPDDFGEGAQYRARLTHLELKSAVGEKRFLRKDGSVFWARRTMSTAHDAAGKPLYVISVVEDITERKQAEERYRATFDNAPVGIMHTAVDDDRILHANAKLCEMLGYPYDELVCLKTDQFIHPDYVGADEPKYREKMLKGEMDTFSSERLYRRKDGSDLWVNRTVSLVRDSAGSPLYFIRIVEDITERTLSARRRAMEHAVTQALAESATVEDAMPIVLRTICQALGWTCGAHWNWNETEELLRCGATWHVELEGVADFVAASRESPNEAPAWRGAAPGTSTGGVVRRVWLSGEPAWFADVMQHPAFRRGPAAARAGLRSAFGFPILAGAQPLGVMEFYSREIKQPDEALLQMVRAIGSQIGQFIQRKQAEDKVTQLAQFDTVTGLPNRSLFNDRLGQMLTQAQRNNWSVAALFLDLDRFKAVNDTYGHAAGDVLLRQVAKRLKDCVRSGDTVGRLSGDEFAVALSNLAKADDAGLVARKLVDGLAAPFDIEGHQTTYISASIGIALFPSDGGEPEVLLKNADTAMYRAKESGRNNYQFYLPQMNERLMARRKLETQLREALERDEYRLHYQPKVSLATGAITGFEALLRWEHGGRLVSPAEFIPILEDTGLIVPVGEWVLRTACEQARQWHQPGRAARTIAVNLSARQFQQKDLATMVERALRETGLEPELLELELTETLLMSDAEDAVQMLHQLKGAGARLSVDDFGTGYSSLAYLKRFPLDTLKIDRTFIRDAISNPDDATITITIINLAHSMRLKVVAEGVETEGQCNFLRTHRCDEMQGFYFARPLGAEECARALVEGRRLPGQESRPAVHIPTLLLVDDNENDLDLMKRTLGGEEYLILTATSPHTGFELLARHGADIVISDYNLPQMSGIEFLGKVRKMYPDTVRAMVTGGDPPTLTRAINTAGIHRFLSKHWSADRLCSEVREAYQQRPRRAKSAGA
jgi:diguanylate cyclase (GGDEF)-like protein/PAS domain S-box-containing protein